LSVTFRDYPNPHEFADDFFFGYLVAATKSERTAIQKKVNRNDFTFKRDSVLRMNLAKGLEPYRHNAVFTQSPLAADGSAYRNATTSALLHRETTVTPFQYPFALNLNDCAEKPEWTRSLLKAIGELNEVAGNHARSYFEMAPASIVMRLTESLVAGYQTYGFQRNTTTDNIEFPGVIDGLLHGKQERVGDKPAVDDGGNPVWEVEPDYPPTEFYIGGEIVKQMSDESHERLKDMGVTVDRDPRRLIQTAADAALHGGSN